MNCHICKIPVADNSNAYYFFQNRRPLCRNCRQALDDSVAIGREKKAAAKEYLGNMLERGDCPIDATLEIKRLLGQKITPEEKAELKAYLGEEHKAEEAVNTAFKEKNAREKSSSVTGFYIAGVVFLIAAIVLFILSIRKVDKQTAEWLGTEAIINIQSTVFCAASFVSSVVCFACGAAVTAIKRK